MKSRNVGILFLEWSVSDMNKSMKQIADELGIDKQKVYRFINNNHIKETVQKGQTKLYDETVQNRIFEHFSQSETVSKSSSQAFQTVLIDTLKKQIESLENDKTVLQNQLDVKDKQIDALNETIKAQAQSINAREHNELAETLETKMLDDGSTKKQGFWSRVFGKGKVDNE